MVSADGSIPWTMRYTVVWTPKGAARRPANELRPQFDDWFEALNYAKAVFKTNGYGVCTLGPRGNIEATAVAIEHLCERGTPITRSSHAN